MGQNERLERIAGLRAAQHAGHVRSNQRFIALARTTSGARTSRQSHLQHVESAAEKQSVCRLEPERRTQNDCLRLLVARKRRTDRFNAGDLGRSRELPEKEKSRSAQIPVRENGRAREETRRPVCPHRKTKTKTAEENGNFEMLGMLRPVAFALFSRKCD